MDLETLFRFLISEYSYVGLFLVQVISSASILIPVPGYIAVFVAGAKLNPLGIALSSGLGSAVGELSGYLIGLEGMKLIQRRSTRLQEYMDEFESVKRILTRMGLARYYSLQLLLSPLISPVSYSVLSDTT